MGWTWIALWTYVICGTLVWGLHQLPGRRGWLIGATIGAVPVCAAIWLAAAAARWWDANCRLRGCGVFAEATPPVLTAVAMSFAWTWGIGLFTRLMAPGAENWLARAARWASGMAVALVPWAYAVGVVAGGQFA